MGAMRKRMLFTRMEGQQTQWVVADTWGAKRKKMLFVWREEELTQWVSK